MSATHEPRHPLIEVGQSNNNDNGDDDNTDDNTDDKCMPPPTINDLPIEVRAIIVKRLACVRDLLALRAVSPTWRLPMAGDRGFVGVMCRALLSDDAFERLMARSDADILLCIVYGTLATAGVSLRSVNAVKNKGAWYWVPRRAGFSYGWGLSLGKVHLPNGPPVLVWSVGRWQWGTLVDGAARSVRLVDTVVGLYWPQCPSPPTITCRVSGQRGVWTGPVVARVAHGRGVWEIDAGHTCSHPQGPCAARCAGRWCRGVPVDGVMTWPSGHTYEGQFRRMVFDGLGVFDTGRGTRYIGHWSAGAPSGNGDLCDAGSRDVDRAQQEDYKCLFKWHQSGDIEQRNASYRYVGAWSHGRPCGRGSLEYADGSRHDGKWYLGEHHGFGERIRPHGRLRRRGYWLHDEPCSHRAYRHYKKTGRQDSAARHILWIAARPLDALVGRIGWINSMIAF